MTMLLRPIDDDLLERLTEVAVADAAPVEVMPIGDGPAHEWTPAQQDAFRAFTRERHGTWDDDRHQTVMFAIVLSDHVIGMIRLSRMDDPDVMQTGMWLGRSWRHRGHGRAALELAVAEAAAAGARTVVADTTPGNAAALSVLKRLGAALTPAGADQVDAALPVGPAT